MASDVFKRRQDLLLRKIGSQYMLVDAVDGSTNLCDVYSLNQTAARIWERIGTSGATMGELADWLCQAYAVGADTALADLGRLLAQWEADGLLRRIKHG